MSNQCPNCQQPAMDAMGKLLTRPQVCQHCGSELRMNLIYTAVLSIIYFLLAVRLLLGNGVSATGMFYVLLLTIVFIGACLFVPFEKKPGR